MNTWQFQLLFLLFLLSPCVCIVCQKNEHQVPLTVYAFSETAIQSTSFSIMSMYSTSDISYYNSGEKLNGFTEYSETICVLENEQMTYRLIITTSQQLSSDLELAVFYGYGTEPSSMRIQIFIKKDQVANTFKGPFTVPHVVCTNGRQYSIFKHNTLLSNQEFVYVWGSSPSSTSSKLLLSFPSTSDYVSVMVDVCIPASMTNLQLMLKSTGGGVWSEDAYVCIFDYITSSLLLATTLTIRESMTIAFPVGVPTIPLDLQVIVPTSKDRRLVTIWGEYDGIKTMIGIVYQPFPYYQHLIKRINVIKNQDDLYSTHFINTYSIPSVSSMKMTVTSRERVIADLSCHAFGTEIYPLSAAIQCPAELVKGIEFPSVGIDTVYTVTCADATIGYTRRCNSFGTWEDIEGTGCKCKMTVDEFGIEWREVHGNSLIQKACGLHKQGMVQRSCTAFGEWVVLSKNCSDIVCPAQLYAGINWSKTLAGTTAKAACHDEGRGLTRKCNDFGEWSSVIEGSCYCSEIYEKGLYWNRTVGDTSRSISCGEGYTGTITRQCSKSGHWLQIRSQCYRMKCDELIVNGAVFPRIYAGDSVTVPCPSPYHGTIRRICQFNGKWGFVYDDCALPSCEHFSVTRNNYGCIAIDTIDRHLDETVAIHILPKPSAFSSSFQMLLPATLCDLDINQPFSLTLQRFEGEDTIIETCLIESIYYKQQCEVMFIPLLKEIMMEDESPGLFGIRIMVQVPFCYDLVLHSLQIRIECKTNCENDKPLILSHICYTPCNTGSFILITSQINLSTSKSYLVSTRAVPERSSLALSSLWSPSLLVESIITPIVIQPKLSVIPKSSHSIRLQWSLQNSSSLAITNFILHKYVSIQTEHSVNPRYLNYVDSVSICNTQDLCKRNSIVVPLGNNGLRYVFVLETVLLASININIKNATVAYIVPDKALVETTITNYDTFANITFFNSNMDVFVNCTVVNSLKHPLSSFTLSIGYGEYISQILGDLLPLSNYLIYCSIRDTFLPPYPFTLSLQMIDYVPAVASVNISRVFYQYTDISFSVNRQGILKCLAFHTLDETFFNQISLPLIDEYGSSLAYSLPLHTVHFLVPVKIVQKEDLPLSFQQMAFQSSSSSITDTTNEDDDDSSLLVACYFRDYYSMTNENVKLMKLKSPSPSQDYHLELMTSVPPPGFEGVYAHANLTLTFSTEYTLLLSDQHYFIIEAVDQFGSTYETRPMNYTSSCLYTPATVEQVICEGHDTTISYEPLIVYTRDCIQNKTKLYIPLPQLGSYIHYGIRTSLPSTLTDSISGLSFNPHNLYYHKYFTHFTSMASSGMVYSKLIRPESRAKMGLTENIIIMFNMNGLIPSSHPFQFRRLFGDVLIEEAIGQNCSFIESAEKETKLVILLSKCVGSLDPNTNYELFISSLCWSQPTKGSPNSVNYKFKTIKNVSQPMIRSVSPTIGSTITRDQSIHFQFNEPVSLGDGNVVISILDTLSQSILFDEIEGKASDILKQESNAFMITLPFYELPFYPYSIYKISWDENTFISYHSVSLPANSTHFYSVDKSCNLVKPKQAVYPYFCTYFYDRSVPVCHCSEIF